jgi:hypothetical protein
MQLRKQTFPFRPAMGDLTPAEEMSKNRRLFWLARPRWNLLR